jgi:hypothetical protein
MPIATPIAIRPAISTPVLVAIAHRIDPTVKMPVVIRIARLRPIKSVSRPLRIDPQTAPIRAALTTSSSANGVNPNSPLMKRIAPLRWATLVRKYKRKPTLSLIQTKKKDSRTRLSVSQGPVVVGCNGLFRSPVVRGLVDSPSRSQ